MSQISPQWSGVLNCSHFSFLPSPEKACLLLKRAAATSQENAMKQSKNLLSFCEVHLILILFQNSFFYFLMSGKPGVALCSVSVPSSYKQCGWTSGRVFFLISVALMRNLPLIQQSPGLSTGEIFIFLINLEPVFRNIKKIKKKTHLSRK